MRRLSLLLVLAACGPVSVEQAEKSCMERAKLAAHPRGEVALGVGSGGRHYGAVDITISSDYLAGRDPSGVFNTCVKQRSGQMPNRPLYEQPDWRP
jgi:hypothetical protein